MKQLQLGTLLHRISFASLVLKLGEGVNKRIATLCTYTYVYCLFIMTISMGL